MRRDLGQLQGGSNPPLEQNGFARGCAQLEDQASFLADIRVPKICQDIQIYELVLLLDRPNNM